MSTAPFLAMLLNPPFATSNVLGFDVFADAVDTVSRSNPPPSPQRWARAEAVLGFVRIVMRFACCSWSVVTTMTEDGTINEAAGW